LNFRYFYIMRKKAIGHSGVAFFAISRRAGLMLIVLLTLLLFTAPSRAGDATEPARIIVAYEETASPAEIAELESRYQLKMVDILREAHSRVYLLSSPTNLSDVLQALSAEPITKYAESDGRVSIQ
jgi:hypothetical protein